MCNKVVIVVPTYNEVGNIPELLKRLADLDLYELKVIIVDDLSPDGTAYVAKEIGDSIGLEINVIKREKKLGMGSAYICGLGYACNQAVDYIIQMDADLSHPPEAIPKMLKMLSECDVVVGSRYVQDGKVDSDWNLTRKIISSCGNFITKRFLGLKPIDITSGFKAYKSEVLKKIPMQKFYSKGFSFQIEMAYHCQYLNLDVIEYPILFNDRVRGVSKFNFSIILEAMKLMVFLRFKKFIQGSL